MTKTIIFDFDGTLADTFETIVSITNRLSVKFGYEPVSKEEIPKLKNLSSREIVQKSGISFFKIPFLIRMLKKELKNRMIEVSLFPGIKELILDLKAEGYSVGILTSNSRENVKALMAANGLENSFDFIDPSAKLFGKHKSIAKLLKREKLKREDVVYVGDETRDLDGAKKAGVRAIAVSWGFNSPEALTRHNPDFLASNPQELMEFLKRKLL
ncbi:MAG: HAD-IA family hydrolase [Cyanobacteriota bacterium]|nr:HAD-IA family hydrolase [Cyanobacteriota bacterium]